MMNVPRDACPADLDELAERYVLGFLSGEDAAAFEDHYITCPHCADVVQATDDYVRAMGEAAREIRAKQARLR
jgi:anti-sigma-K factor RskA